MMLNNVMWNNEIAKVVLFSLIDRIRDMVYQGGKPYLEFAKLECVALYGSANEFKTRGLITEYEYNDVMDTIRPILSDLMISL